MKAVWRFFVLIACLSDCSPRPLVFSVSPDKGLPNLVTDSVIFDNLTATDKNQYILTAKLGEYCSDSCGNSSFLLYASLKNNSKDTLTYFDWNCEHFVWGTNNANVRVGETRSCDDCLHNFMDYFYVPPHKSVSFSLRMRPTGKEQKFKLSMALLRPNKKLNALYYAENDFGVKRVLRRDTANTVWSNEIVTPQRCQNPST